MKYLFLDTESSNCYGNLYKLCEYGYVTTDESFSFIPGGRRDVVVNPGKNGKFNLVGRKDGRNLTLAHEYSEYAKAPLFEDFYVNLRFLLERKDMMIFLWASINDIQALMDNCFRYRLPKIHFVSYDVQMLFKAVIPEVQGIPSLEKAAAYLEIDLTGITPHRPDDDALMTMLILKALCQRSGKTPSELVKECPRCEMDSISAYAALVKRRQKKMQRRHQAAQRNRRKTNSSD